MSALLQAPAPLLRTMVGADLDQVAAIERQAYDFPWSRGNFVDSLAAGYLAEVLVDSGSGNGAIVGYFVAMIGVGEMHLLNLTVAPDWHGQGHGHGLLRHLMQRCRHHRLESLWLEVRFGNHRARALYRRHGFAEVGLRRGYYPAPFGAREDAVIMSLTLPEADDAVE